MRECVAWSRHTRLTKTRFDGVDWGDAGVTRSGELELELSELTVSLAAAEAKEARKKQKKKQVKGYTLWLLTE